MVLVTARNNIIIIIIINIILPYIMTPVGDPLLRSTR